jgi:D-hydroxyproline dehydrogenase subunit beta
MMARRAEAVSVLEAFVRTEMGEGCRILSRAAATARCRELADADVQAVLESSIDLRVESREAIPKIAAWLAERYGVVFLLETAVLSVEPPRLETSRGVVNAGAAVVCPGDDIASVFPNQIAMYNVTRCSLQMLRLADPGFRLPGVLMSDLGLVRYAGYGALPEATALRERLSAEQGEHLQHGIHLIAVQSSDGTLVVGDSHQYALTPDFFADERVDQLILEEFAAATGRAPSAVRERWTGTYPSCTDRTLFIDAPASDVRIVMITSGSGASTDLQLAKKWWQNCLHGVLPDGHSRSLRFGHSRLGGDYGRLRLSCAGQRTACGLRAPRSCDQRYASAPRHGKGQAGSCARTACRSRDRASVGKGARPRRERWRCA